MADWFGVGAHGVPKFEAGEDIFILDQGTRPVPPPVIDHDYWLLDDEIVIRMYYSGSGEYGAAELIKGDIDMYRAARDAALAAAEPFPGWWARHPKPLREGARRSLQTGTSAHGGSTPALTAVGADHGSRSPQPVRVDLVERFEKLVADYNAGSINTETFFQELVNFSTELTAEEARSLSEGLAEEQLAIFDLLMRPAPELSDDEKMQVKRVAEELLAVLKRDKIVLDWRKEQSTRAAVRVAVEETLDRLPAKFTRQLYAQKCDGVYQHVFDIYWDDGHSVYDEAA